MSNPNLYAHFLECRSVSTDTRKIKPGCLFVALRGEKFNGNSFAAEALALGARYAVIDDKNFEVPGGTILVSDTLLALQQLAREHRERLTIPVISLTGSNGKTTTKELVREVLSKKYRTFATTGNLNNHIGVPLSLLAIDDSIEIAVIEMGANHLGEIALLSSIAQPTHGLITNIGKAHIGTFGGFENIVRGKSELYQFLREHEGVVFINSQNPILANMAKRFNNPVFYPAPGDFVEVALVASDPWVQIRTETNQLITTHLVGAYNFENIAVALCIGKYFGVAAADAAQAVAEYQPANMRSQVVEKGSNKIILDAYNANPSSMAAAIDSLASMQAKNKVLILGDMFELEEEAEREHRAILQQIATKSFHAVYACGQLFFRVRDALPTAKYFETRDELIREIIKNPVRQATILIKASRGMGFERVMDVLPND
jgi:UDP-N-acetylmuramoyl-tripeptide--D-alanyl-D-alanine ligase